MYNKITNVLIYLLLNIFFLVYLPDLANESSNPLLQTIYHNDFQIGYIFVSNLIASFGNTFLFYRLFQN